MSANPPPIGPDLGQWAQATRRYLQRWVGRLPWKTSDDNPSENGVMRWDEGAKRPVVSSDDAFRDIVMLVGVPASASATGVTGQWAYDASYIYVCTATDTWKRAALATW